MRTFLILYFLFSFFLFCFFSSGVVDSQDGLQYLTIARRMYYNHTFEMPEARFDDGTNIYMNVQQSMDGKWYASTGLGYSLAMLPAVFIEDVILKLAGLQPLTAFPLQNDWPVMLFASMTNAFFGAVLVVTLYLYLRSLQVPHTWASVLGMLLVVTSNLFNYTKHSFAQMMFASFLLLTFYNLRQRFVQQSGWWTVAAGITFGVVIIAYNPTFMLAVPALVVYYLLLTGFTWFNKESLVQIVLRSVLDLVRGLIGGVSFIALFMWFNSVRFGGSGVSVEATGSIPSLPSPPAYILYEGVWSLLFSPGKSIFLFYPAVIILFIFWFKLHKKNLPEVVAAAVLFLVFLLFFASHTITGFEPSWHGEASWGPRYMVPAMTLILVLVGIVISKLQTTVQTFVVVPILGLGLYISLLGTVLPYQVRFYQLNDSGQFNGEEFKLALYGNMIPRYSPVFIMSKLVAKRIARFDYLYSHGTYNYRLRDGFEREFVVGDGVWREPHEVAVMQFENTEKIPVSKLAFQLRNHQMDASSSSAVQMQFELNGSALLPEPVIIPVQQEKLIELAITDLAIRTGTNTVVLRKKFIVEPPSELAEKQVVFLQSAYINNVPQSLATIDYPYVSEVSKKLFGAEYEYYGNRQIDPWKIWHMRSAIYENTFDFWWLRPFHYWDLPKVWFGVLFGFICSIVVTAGLYIYWPLILLLNKSIRSRIRKNH